MEVFATEPTIGMVHVNKNSFTYEEWREFVKGVKAGEFRRLMICKHCRVADHEHCEFPTGTKEQPASCTCQHRDRNGKKPVVPST